MMQEPITTQLLNGVWDTIKDAVASGLDTAVPYTVPRPALDTVAVVSTEKIKASGGWECIEHPDAPTDIPSARVRLEQSGDAFDIMHCYELGYHDLQAPNTDAIKKWATAARQFELNLALRYYEDHAKCVPYKTVGKLYQTYPDGWGQRRCVIFSPGIPDKWEGADLDLAVEVDFKSKDGIQALVYRVGGGPYVRRPAPLSLGWTPLDHCKAELLLTEQLEFVNTGPKTIIGVRIDPPVPSAEEASPPS
jgi:hypothetical protein